MAKSLKALQLVPLPLLLMALQATGGAAPLSAASKGQALAKESCAACHAITGYGLSSNPNAPTFALIANQEGVTRETLSTWLRGAHNYPREMDFYLNEQKVRALVAYMLTLKDKNYRRPPD